MNKFPILFLLLGFLLPNSIFAQCAICTKNAQQMGPEAASGLNAGILFLMIIPLIGMIIMTIYIIKKSSN